jgi:hypothetical protein
MTKAYKVEAKEDRQVLGKVLGTRYAATVANSKELRDGLMSQFDLKKNQIMIEDCEIPSDKYGLLQFINGVAALADMVETGESE